MTERDWFRAVEAKDLAALERGLAAGHRDLQDEYGMTALHLAVAHDWREGVERLLAAKADTELRHHRTGATALYTAAQQTRNAAIAALLLDAGANPDAENYWGVTPRKWSVNNALEGFSNREGKPSRPAPRIQNAEQLAEHYHPKFQIPSRRERESLKPGAAVDVHVLGNKPPAIKVRIYERTGTKETTRYAARFDPLDQETNLPPGSSEVRFGPEHVATVYVKKA